jgi:hypothetical protein
VKISKLHLITYTILLEETKIVKQPEMYQVLQMKSAMVLGGIKGVDVIVIVISAVAVVRDEVMVVKVVSMKNNLLP